MSGVSNNGDLNSRLIWHLSILTRFVGSHSDLESGGHGLEVVGGADIAILQARSHRVNIEEGILAVLNVCHWVLVKSLVSLVANSWQV